VDDDAPGGRGDFVFVLDFHCCATGGLDWRLRLLGGMCGWRWGFGGGILLTRHMVGVVVVVDGKVMTIEAWRRRFLAPGGEVGGQWRFFSVAVFLRRKRPRWGLSIPKLCANARTVYDRIVE
jgi:hypothetical protein